MYACNPVVDQYKRIIEVGNYKCGSQTRQEPGMKGFYHPHNYEAIVIILEFTFQIFIFDDLVKILGIAWLSCGLEHLATTF